MVDEATFIQLMVQRLGQVPGVSGVEPVPGGVHVRGSTEIADCDIFAGTFLRLIDLGNSVESVLDRIAQHLTETSNTMRDSHTWESISGQIIARMESPGALRDPSGKQIEIVARAFPIEQSRLSKSLGIAQLSECLVVDYPTWMQKVLARDLVEWGVSAEDAFFVGRCNLWRHLDQAGDQFSLTDRLIWSIGGDDYVASRLLLPNRLVRELRDLMPQATRWLVVAPTRSTLIVTPIVGIVFEVMLRTVVLRQLAEEAHQRLPGSLPLVLLCLDMDSGMIIPA